MIDIQFSENYRISRYADVHYYFFLEYARLAGAKINFVPDNDKVYTGGESRAFFSCIINDSQVIVDFCDFYDWHFKDSEVPYFKFQSTNETPIKCHPLGPPIVGIGLNLRATMDDYFDIRKDFKFFPGDQVLCKQSPNGLAKDRRNNVQAMLVKNFPNIDIHPKGLQIDFWKKHEQCLAAVCVPGANNNMIDRGHMELLGLGVCTISPQLNTRLAHNKILVPNVHYIRCKDDYSDLLDIIEDLKSNKKNAKEIGENARKFFNDFWTPENYWDWILTNI